MSISLFIKRNIDDFYTQPIDFMIFYTALKNFNANGELYARSDSYDKKYGPSAAIYKFPPPFQLHIIPLVNIPPPLNGQVTIRLGYTALYIACLFILFKTLVKLFNLMAPKKLYLACIFIITGSLAMPFFECIRWFLFEIPLLIVFLFIFIIPPNKKVTSFSTGILLGYSAISKIYPAFMMGPYLYQKNYLAIIGCIIGVSISLLISLYLFGLGEHLFYINTILPVIGTESITEKSVNLNLAKFLYSTGITSEINNNIFQFMRITFLIASGFLLAYKYQMLKKNTQAIASFFIVTMFFCFPNYWPQYQILLLIPFFYLTAKFLKYNDITGLVLLAVSFVFMAITDTLWRDILDWDVKYHALNIAFIQQRAVDQGLGLTLFRNSPASWLAYYGFECRALLPVILWSLFARDWLGSR